MPIFEQRDLVSTRATLTEWLAEALGADDLELGDLTPPAASGFSNDTLLFDATWTDGGEPRSEGFVARLQPSGYAIFPDLDVLRQYRVMAALAEHTAVPLPRMVAMEADESVLGAPFFVMERIEGRIPSDSPPFTMEGWVLDLTAGERERMWWSGVEAMAEIHRADWTTLGVEFLDHPEDGPPGLDQQLAYYRRYLAWAAEGEPQPLVESTLAWVEANRPPAGTEPVALVWGDARPGNMIFRDSECVAVLDWEMATLGNPVEDLGWWLFLYRHHTEGLNLAPLDGFPSREATVDRWAELTGQPADHVDFYEVFAGFRFAVIMLRLSHVLVDYGVIPPDSDLGTNNPVTQLLAGMLDLPPPGERSTQQGY